MTAKRFARMQKATAILPLALLSAAWTASLAGVGATAVVTASSPEAPPATNGGPSVPAEAIEAPASVSAPDEVSPGFSGNATQIAATTSTNGIPSAALSAYQRAETVINSADASCNLPWQLLAGIGRVESDHGRYAGNALNAQGIATPGIYGIALDGTRNTARILDTDAGQYDNDTTYDRAVGPMQFIPSTWSVVGVDADNDGQRNPQDIDDAALASAVYLCSGEDDLSSTTGQRNAVFRYNHSQSYVDLVLSIMNTYLEGDFMSVPNGTTNAGFLTPVPPTTTTTTAGEDEGRTEDDGDVETASPTEQVPDESTPDEPEPTTPDDDVQDDPKDDAPRLPIPPVTIPALPETSIEPVDELLTRAQALVQCTLNGVIDNPLTVVNELTVCLSDLMKP